MITINENILNYSDNQLKELIVASYDNIILIENLADDKKALGEFVSRIGIHSNRNEYFFTDPDEPTITRVTNKRVNNKKIGLFADLDLAWHCHGHTRNVVAENTLLLYCSQPGNSEYGITGFCNSRKAYYDLPEDIKITVDNISVRMDLSYKEVWKPLVFTHPVDGKKSLHFCPSFIVEWNYKYEGESLWNYIYDHLFSDKYCYYHKWKTGDMIISDQRASLHNRTEVQGDRLLYRFCVNNENL